ERISVFCVVDADGSICKSSPEERQQAARLQYVELVVRRKVCEHACILLRRGLGPEKSDLSLRCCARSAVHPPELADDVVVRYPLITRKGQWWVRQKLRCAVHCERPHHTKPRGLRRSGRGRLPDSRTAARNKRDIRFETIVRACFDERGGSCFTDIDAGVFGPIGIGDLRQ